MMKIVLTEEARPSVPDMCFGCSGLGALLRSIGYEEHQVRGDAALLERELRADLVVRDGVAPADLLDDLEQALRERAGMDVALQLAAELSDVLVLRGSLVGVEAAAESSERQTLHIYTDQRDEEPGGAGFGEGPAATTLASLLARGLNLPVVDETIGGEDIAKVRLHHSATNTTQIESVLRNLESQSAFELSVEKRSIEMLRVSAR
jgi:hypothetical protein